MGRQQSGSGRGAWKRIYLDLKIGCLGSEYWELGYGGLELKLEDGEGGREGSGWAVVVGEDVASGGG